MNNKQAVTFDKISFKYSKEDYVLKNLTLSFEQGKMTAIIGDNGSGKSTLLKIISGLLIPDSGKLSILETIVTDDNAEELIGGNVGLVFQNPDTQFVASVVRDDLAFGLENRNYKTKEINELITKEARVMDIEDLLDKDVTSLSGGQKQKVALAGIMILKPKILLLDEAVSMLDDKSRNEFYLTLKKMREDYTGLTIIDVTHDEKEVMLADKVLVLNKGNIVFEGTPKELFSNPKLCGSFNLSPFFYDELSYKLGVKIQNKEELKQWIKN